MNDITTRLTSWLPEPLREDPKKLAFLTVLMLVFAIVMFRTFFSGGPAAARASIRRAQETAPAGAVERVSGGTVATSAATVQWLKRPIMPLSRDLFAIHVEDYPLVATKAATLAPSPVTGFWDDIEKSRSGPADQKKRREMLIEDLQREAAKLRLQTTMMGPVPQAIIGGNLVREGSLVSPGGADAGVEFRVLKILSRRVVVEREGIRLELSMVE